MDMKCLDVYNTQNPGFSGYTQHQVLYTWDGLITHGLWATKITVLDFVKKKLSTKATQK